MRSVQEADMEVQRLKDESNVDLIDAVMMKRSI